MTGQPYRDGKVHVLSERCASCIGRRDGIGRRLTPGRVKELVEANLAADSAPACHSTTYGQDERGEALCRWYVDTYGDRVAAIRLAMAMGLVEYQTPPEGHAYEGPSPS